jgi:hypothetical protein
MLIVRLISAVASGSVLPSSRVISSATDASVPARISAALNRHSARRGAGSAAHAGCAAAAAANAASTSSAVDAWKRPTISSTFAGFTLANVALVRHATHSPPMKLRK